MEDQIKHPHQTRVAPLNIIHQYATHFSSCCRVRRPRCGCPSELTNRFLLNNADERSRLKTRSRTSHQTWTPTPAQCPFPLLRQVGHSVLCLSQAAPSPHIHPRLPNPSTRAPARLAVLVLLLNQHPTLLNPIMED